MREFSRSVQPLSMTPLTHGTRSVSARSGSEARKSIRSTSRYPRRRYQACICTEGAILHATDQPPLPLGHEHLPRGDQCRDLRRLDTIESGGPQLRDCRRVGTVDQRRDRTSEIQLSCPNRANRDPLVPVHAEWLERPVLRESGRGSTESGRGSTEPGQAPIVGQAASHGACVARLFGCFRRRRTTLGRGRPDR